MRDAPRFSTRCSVPREERIEAILAAWYELVNCEPSERARFRDKRNGLLDQAIAGHTLLPPRVAGSTRPSLPRF